VDHPLDNCRLKVARAKEQFDSLHDEIAQFAKNNPCPVEIKVDPQTGDELIEVPEPPVFPGRWGVIVGEITYGLRSSLDHLIGAFLRKAGREPHGDTAFPISKTRDRYLRKNNRGITHRDRVLRGVPEPLKQRVDSLQPYQRGDLAEDDPLFVLSQIANRDEHREPHPAYVWVMTPRGAFGFPGDVALKTIRVRLPKEGGREVQAEFKTGATLTDPPLKVHFPKVNMKRPTGVEPVFGGQRSRPLTLDDLRALIGYIDSLIESFAGDVEPSTP
jgi:hypothetical protein